MKSLIIVNGWVKTINLNGKCVSIARLFWWSLDFKWLIDIKTVIDQLIYKINTQIDSYQANCYRLKNIISVKLIIAVIWKLKMAGNTNSVVQQDCWSAISAVDIWALVLRNFWFVLISNLDGLQTPFKTKVGWKKAMNLNRRMLANRT